MSLISKDRFGYLSRTREKKITADLLSQINLKNFQIRLVTY